MLAILRMHPKAKLIAHPECQRQVLIAADFVGSTSALLKFTETDPGSEYIVATESGILHQMKKQSPHKTFIPAPPIDSTCGCNDCRFMKLHDLQKIYDSLNEEKFEININPSIMEKARIPIQRMFELI